MLKRILFAVGVLTLGFIVVVILVNKQLRGVGGKMQALAEVVTPLSKGAGDSSDHTAQMMQAVGEASMPVEDSHRADLKVRALEAADALKADVALLQSDKFKSLHGQYLQVPALNPGEAARKATPIEVLKSLGESVSQIRDTAGATIDLAQKQAEVKRDLVTAQEELSRVFRSSTELASLDAKGFNTLTRSVMMVMYSRSLGDTANGRSKFGDGLKALQKGNPTPEQEALITQLRAAFDKTMQLLTESLASNDDYALFVKAADSIRNEADAIAVFSEGIFKRDQAELGDTVSKAISTSLLLSVVTILVGVGITVVIARKITRPLELATQLVARVAGNDLTETVNVTTTDEVGQIGLALNTMVANLRQNVGALHQDSLSLTAASTELSQISLQVSANASQTYSQAEVVSNASQRVSQDVHSVAAAVEEMSTSMSEIMRTTSEATRISGRAAEAARGTNATVAKLGDSSAQISDVVKVITGIASQTNLLALNATIEAARAGEAGRGFAVVAQEVKELAQQTSKATEEISIRIGAIQSDAGSAVSAILEIGQIIAQIDEFQATIASAVQEQGAAMSEISRSLSTATVASLEISSNIEKVASAARDTTTGASETANTAETLTKVASGLRRVVEQFTLPKTA